MLTKKSLNMIVSTPTFIHNANRLSFQLKCSRQDSSECLIVEMLEHRLRSWTDTDVEQAVKNDLPSLKWKIKYAARDCYRRESRDASQEQEKAEMLVNAGQQNDNTEQTEQALALIPDLFKNSQTRDWVKSVLKVGKEQTMADFGQNQRQFSNKLSRTVKYANEHRQKIGDIKMRQISDGSMRELEVWNQFDQLITFSPQQVQQFINQHREMFDKIIDSASIKKQGVLLDDFKNADLSDKKSLIKLIQKRVDELEHELTNREDK